MKNFFLIILVLMIVAPTAKAQQEIHLIDGSVLQAPIHSIQQDYVRIYLTKKDLSRRIPLTNIEKICFQDGGVLSFVQGELQFDQIIQPVSLTARGGQLYLEGVRELKKEDVARLLDPVSYQEYRKQSRYADIGEIALISGLGMTTPYVGLALYYQFVTHRQSPAETFRDMGLPLQIVSVAGIGVLAGGIWMMSSGNKGCRKIAASYNNGVGIAFSF